MGAEPVERLKERVLSAIDRHATETLAIGDDILRHPEFGFFETRTAGEVVRYFDSLDIPSHEGLALTGVRAELRGGQPGPTVAILGELDALQCHDHPFADPTTHAAHACGHHAQIAQMLTVAAGLHRSGVMAGLAGNVVLMAVPAEEYVQLERRLELKRAGRIEFIGGKPELVRLGAFDGVDLAMMCHTGTPDGPVTATIDTSSNGLIGKLIQFHGRAAHAGGEPHKGVNALNAASLALTAIAYQRETFQDEDAIRVHPIITRGGEIVNAVPADVRLETYVRGKTPEAIADAARKVDRAIRAGAIAVGARATVTTIPGYFPQRNCRDLGELYRANVIRDVGEQGFAWGGHIGFSTDMGDIMHLMPAIHPGTGAATGRAHGNDYLVTDPELAMITPARAMALTVIDLLSNDAAAARRIIAANPPALTKAAYLAHQRRLDTVVEYGEE